MLSERHSSAQANRCVENSSKACVPTDRWPRACSDSPCRTAVSQPRNSKPRRIDRDGGAFHWSARDRASNPDGRCRRSYQNTFANSKPAHATLTRRSRSPRASWPMVREAVSEQRRRFASPSNATMLCSPTMPSSRNLCSCFYFTRPWGSGLAI